MAVMGNMDIGAGFALLTAVLVVFMQTGASLMAENRQPLVLSSVMMERFQWLFGWPPLTAPSPLSLAPLPSPPPRICAAGDRVSAIS